MEQAVLKGSISLDIRDKKILITGGTGSLGRALTSRLLHPLGVPRVVILSRDELKQSVMEKDFNYDERLRFFLGDIRDYQRVVKAMAGIDVVIHAAALKRIDKGEYDPDEFHKTNVIGTQNVIRASMHHNIEKMLFTSTDKACISATVYGATKALAERMVTAANYWKGECETAFSSVRYGNVFGSRGSVIHRWRESGDRLQITDPKMTRFSITLGESVDFILSALNVAKGGEIFVPKLKAYRLIDLADAFCELEGKNKIVEHIGIRGAEKMHELLINEYESSNTYEIDNMYMILPSEHLKKKYALDYDEEFPKVSFKTYSSDRAEKLPKKELKELIKSVEEVKFGRDSCGNRFELVRLGGAWQKAD